MDWPKIAISAVIIVTAIAIGIQWRKVAGAVVAPVTLVALYAVWRWQRDD
jgi:membrane protein implicated in regulation of membrane protease activity